MTPEDYTLLLEETRKLMPLSPPGDVVLVTSGAVSLLAFQFFDWRAVLEFLKLRENRERIMDGIKAGQLAATPPAGAGPPRH